MRQLARQCGYYLLLTGAAAWWSLAPAWIATAQEVKPRSEPAPVAAGEKPAADEPFPAEVMPPVYHLKDKDGTLQPVPGFTYEQFIELYKLKNQLDQQNQQPTFTIEDLALAGSAKGPAVELTARYSVLVHFSGWVRVPLRLGGAVLREQATHEGEGEHFLHPDADGDGYVSWIRSEPGKRHQVTLKLVAPVVPLGPESHVRVTVPRAAMSQLELQVPLEKPVVKLSEGSTLESAAGVGGGTLLKIVGLGSELDVGWHAAENQVASLPTVLESSCAQLIRIDGRSVNTEARLSVRSSGGGFDRFQVRLPPGADYVETNQAGASLVSVEAASPKGKLYEVKLTKKTIGPIEIRLVTQRAYDPLHSGDVLELGGFEVVGAVRQWGTIGVQVEGNWQVQWSKDERIRDELAGVLGSENLTTAFEYSAQPYSLAARITPQKTRMRVEGEYVVLVDGDEARLHGKLKYTIRGAKIRTLEIDVPGWDVEAVGPAALVNVDDVAVNQNDPLVVPLLQPVSGELELTLEARQKIPSGATRVELEVPRPQAETIAPATVAVAPADDIELTLQPDQTIGLAPQAVRPQLKQLPERQQDPLFFRTTGGTGRFVAALKVFEQAISAALSAQLEVDERETRIDERMVFQIAYHPTDHLTLDVPAAVRPDKLTLMLDGQKLLPPSVRERADGGSSLRVPLPAPRIGRCELAVSYVTRHDKPSGAGSTSVKVPLVLPAESQLTSNELTVVPKSGISVNYPKGFSTGPWIEDSRTPRPGGTSQLQLTARRAVAEVALALTYTQRRSDSALAIEQAWIQSRLTDAHRQDRAVYRFATTEPRLRILLPAGVELASSEVILDGRRVKPEPDPAREPNELVVPISGAPRGDHVVELRYHFADRASPGKLALAAPRFKQGGWIRQLRWQLILPSGEHAIFSPDDFTREFRWAWSNLFWRRQAPLDERELESWIGAAPSGDSGRLSGETQEKFALRQQTRADSTNRYLFSTVGSPEVLRVYSLSRARLVLAASLPLLACGLLLIYFPTVRHPAALLAVAVFLAAVSLVDPDTALVFAQASSLGLVLAIAAAMMARVSVHPVPSSVPIRGSSKAIDRHAIEAYAQSSGSGSQPSTATNPLVPSTGPESTP